MAKNHYCKHCNQKDSNFMSGAMFGALFGAVLGVLFAPAPGEKTRKKLKEVGEDLTEKGQKALSEVSEIAKDVKVVAEPLVEEVEKTIAPALKKARASGKDVQFQVLEKIEQLVDEAGDMTEDIEKGAKKFFKGTKR